MKALIIEDEKAAVRNLMALLGEVDPVRLSRSSVM